MSGSLKIINQTNHKPSDASNESKTLNRKRDVLQVVYQTIPAAYVVTLLINRLNHITVEKLSYFL